MPWTSKLALQRYEDISTSLGPPDWISARTGGGAGWEDATLEKKGLIFSSIRVMDEAVRHTSPMEHCDCLRVSVSVNIPLGYLHDVLGVSESIIYDRLKQKLSVRCHFIGAAIAALNAALDTIYHDLGRDKVSARYQSYLSQATSPDGLVAQYRLLVGHLQCTWKHFPLKCKADLVCDYTKFKVVPMPHELQIIEAADIN
jgi:hypothetical protein